MGAGAGGYVPTTLQTPQSEYDVKTHQLHRVSELSFAGAPVPVDRKVSSALKRADVALAPDTVPAGKLGLGGVRPGDVLTFNLYALMDDGSHAEMGLTAAKPVTDDPEHAFGATWAGFAVALAPRGGRFKRVADITLKSRCGLFALHARRLVDLAAKARLPAVYGAPSFAEAGGLMAWHGDMAEVIRRTAAIVGRVLTAATPATLPPATLPPATLPVEAIGKLDMAINVGTARTLGLRPPRSLLSRADGIIRS